MAFTNPFSISDYKSLLGYGSRTNLFYVQLTFPSILSLGEDAEKEFTILCRTATLPASRVMTSIDVPYQGDYFRLAGDKAAEPDFTFTFQNTEDMRLRNIFELWTDTIQQDLTGLRTSPILYKAPSMFVSQLNKSKEIIKKVELISAFPLTVSGIDFTLGEGAVSETTIVMAIDAHRNVAV